MTKRFASALLWFYAGWTFGSLIASALGMHPAFGPVIGGAAATLFAVDPRQIIWRTGEVTRTVAEPYLDIA